MHRMWRIRQYIVAFRLLAIDNIFNLFAYFNHSITESDDD
jgi:hypothetical protein